MTGRIMAGRANVSLRRWAPDKLDAHGLRASPYDRTHEIEAALER
ncbi:MAG: hypothetical protein ACLT98_08620 [Eggerthellaceae bacterium]